LLLRLVGCSLGACVGCVEHKVTSNEHDFPLPGFCRLGRTWEMTNKKRR
jgi:hypothetical protein